MDKEKIIGIVEELSKDRSRYDWKSSDLEEYLKSKGFEFTSDNLMELILQLSEHQIFRWLKFISSKLPELAEDTDVFTNLLSRIISKIKNDLAQGPFIDALISIGKCNPELGISLFNRIINSQDSLLESYSGIILGGSGKSDYEKVFDAINSNIKNVNSEIKAAYIKAMRVIFDKQAEINSDVFRILGSVAQLDESTIVRSELASACIDFYRINKDDCLKLLMFLAKQNDSEVRSLIASRLWTADLDDKENEIKLLKECSRDDNLNTLTNVAMALSTKANQFPDEGLGIIKDWIIRRKFNEIRDIDYWLQEMGKAAAARYTEIISSWIAEQNPILIFTAPQVLANVCKSNTMQLIKYLPEMIKKGPNYAEVAIRTISELLTDKTTEDIVTECFSILKQLAKESKYDDTLHRVLIEIFVQKPRFAEEVQVIKITQEWGSDPDPAIRKQIVGVLGILAEDKIDFKETLLLEIGSKTKVAKIVGTNIEKKETTEGNHAYTLLESLAEDANPNVREEAKATLDHVITRLANKELMIDAHIFERKIFEPIKNLRNFVSYIEKPKMRLDSTYPEKDFDLILRMKDGKEFLIETKFFRKVPHNETIEKLVKLAQTAKTRYPHTQFILIVNDKLMIEDRTAELGDMWNYIFDEPEWLHFISQLAQEQTKPLAERQEEDNKAKP
jgi:hypothetical protein